MLMSVMAATPDPQKKAPAFHELYPHLTGDQLVEAKDRLDQYIALAMRIIERLREDPSFPENLPALTGSSENFKIDPERSIEKQTDATA
jgi:hypothetical protein